MTSTESSPLGKSSTYENQYNPELLFPIPRSEARSTLGISDPLPFFGVDVWNAYELSWLGKSGKPVVAIAEFRIPAQSKYLVESKSFKLYLNSFNQSTFNSADDVRELLIKDLSKVTEGSVEVSIMLPWQWDTLSYGELKGNCIDEIEVETNIYEPDPSLLKTTEQDDEQWLYSHMLKSNCPVTAQPDWASVYIHYQGPHIDTASLLKYIISYRNHSGFHEACVEKIFMDLMEQCQPKLLTVYARFTRRGGLDINPYRSNFPTARAHNRRLPRQ